MTRRLVGISMAVLTTLLALVVLWQFRVTLVYVLISLAFAASMRPLINRLVGRTLWERTAWVFVFMAGLAGFGFLLFLASGIAIQEIQLFFETVSVQGEWIMPVWLEGNLFQTRLLEMLPTPGLLLKAFSGDEGQFILPALLVIMQDIGDVVTGFLVILILSIYWATNQIHFERLWLSLLPTGQRKKARNFWRMVESGIGAYIDSQVILSLLALLLLGAGYWVLGFPYPALLALAGALLSLVPVVGKVLFFLPPLLVGLVTSAQVSLITVLYALLVQIFLGGWVQPRLFKRRWENPILTLVLLIALADAFGLMGIILAPPLSIVCQVLWNNLVSHRSSPGVSAQISDLKERQERLRAMVKEMDETPLPLVTSSMERLSRLIEEADSVLPVALMVENLGENK